MARSNYTGRKERGKTAIVVILLILLVGALFFYIYSTNEGVRTFVDGLFPVGTAEPSPVPELSGTPVPGASADPTTAVSPTEVPSPTPVPAVSLREGPSVYLPVTFLENEENLDRLENWLKQGDITGVTVDLKITGGAVLFAEGEGAAADNALAVELFDLSSLCDLCARYGVAVTGRLSCFDDDVAPRTVKDSGIMHKSNVLWLDYDNARWLDPGREAAREYLYGLADAALDAGVKAVCLTDVGYPVLGKMDLVLWDGDAEKDSALALFLEEMTERCRRQGGEILLELPQEALLNEERRTGMGLDTVLEDLPANYLVPVILPSAFQRDTVFGSTVVAVPGASPAETVTAAIRYLTDVLEIPAERLRPTLQAFDGASLAYGLEELEAQASACESLGVTGWCFWNEKGDYPIG